MTFYNPDFILSHNLFRTKIFLDLHRKEILIIKIITAIRMLVFAQ